MRALGVSIFAGGFSIGVEKHFDVLAHFERTPYGVKSWRGYRPHVPVHVSKTTQWPEADFAGKVDFVYGNPPCAAWSPTSVGYARKGASPWLEWAEDVVRVGHDVGAKVIAIESVRGAMLHGAPFYRSLRDKYGLCASWIMVNARDHGLAQHRPRVFIVFTKGEVFAPEWEALPTPRILDQIGSSGYCAPGEVLRDLESSPISSKSIYCPGRGIKAEELLKCVPALKPGKRLWAREITTEELEPYSPDIARLIGQVKFAGHMLTRASIDQPCPVVYGLARYVHPTEDRLLTLRELMRLMGYPDDFTFGVDQATALRMLGKSICPPVGDWLAGEVAAYLRGDRDVLYQREALFDCCSDPPKRGLPPETGLEAGSGVEEDASSHDLGELADATGTQVTPGVPEGRLTKTVTRRPRTQLPDVTIDPAWEELPGPTALARLLIGSGATDDEILAATGGTFGHRAAPLPHLFTRKDLERLRARIVKKETDA